MGYGVGSRQLCDTRFVEVAGASRRGAATLADYARYRTNHPGEYQLLAASFLFNVTEFFRDPEIFASLRERVLPELIAQARD